MDECANPSSALIVDGVVNTCFVNLYIPGGVGVLLLLGLTCGMVNTRDMKKDFGEPLTLDKIRGLFLALLVITPAVAAVLGFASPNESGNISMVEAVGAVLRVVIVLLVWIWHRRESWLGLGEALPLKLWWLLDLLAKITLVFSVFEISEDGAFLVGRALPLSLFSIEVGLEVAMFLVYLRPVARAQNQPLLGREESLARTLSTRIRSPEETANIFSFMFFAWFSPIIDKAVRRDKENSKLDETDLYPIQPRDMARKQYEKLDIEWMKEVEKDKQGIQPSLAWAIARCMGWEVAKTAWIKMIMDVNTFVGPVLINRVLTYLENDEGTIGQGLLLAFGMIATTGLKAILEAHYFQLGYRNGMHIRAGLIVTVFQKSLRVLPWSTPEGITFSHTWEEQLKRPIKDELEERRTVADIAEVDWKANLTVKDKNSQTLDLFAESPVELTKELFPLNVKFVKPDRPTEAPKKGCCSKSAPRAKPSRGVQGMGKMTNMISADTDKFTFLMPYFNIVWSGPFQLIVALIMLFTQLGASVLGGVFVMIFFIFLSNKIQVKARACQMEAMKIKDARLKVETELLKIVKIIKLYAWETTIDNQVKDMRNKELYAQLRYKLWSMGFFLTFSLSPTLVAVATFSIYTAVLGETLDAATAFTALSLFNILSFPMGAIPMMARFLMEAYVSSERIEAFLLADEIAGKPGKPVSSTAMVEVNAALLQWPDRTPLLKDVSISVERGEVMAIVGRTGTGKSGFLYALLGELPIAAPGRAALGGSVAYCAQSAWIRNCTVRENITNAPTPARELGRPGRYEEVLHACALSADMQSLPNGDQTPIGDRGVNLSGGQKQRIALARAVYADHDILVLDDVFSALDAHVTAHVCEELLRGPLMKGKTVVLVTHSKRAMQNVNRVVALSDDRRIAFDGTYAEFRESGLMDDLAAEEEKPATTVEASAEGENDPKAGAKAAPGAADSSNAKAGGAKPAAAASSGAPAAGVNQESRAQGAVKASTYIAYIQACGGWPPVLFFLFTIILSEGSKNATDLFLTSWTASGGAASGAAVYALIGLSTAVFGIFYTVTRIFLGQRASRLLHEQCVSSLLRARMTFFDTTPNGQIINRLAEDTNILDYNLPQTASANIVWAWKSLIIVVIMCLESAVLLILLVPLFFLYYRLSQRFLPGVRDLRRLDTTARSPIFSHFGEVFGGVSTVRAFGHQENVLKQNVLKLERQIEAYYLNNTAARWLSLRLSMLSTVLIGGVVLVGIWLCKSAPAGWHPLPAAMVGLSITYAMNLTGALNQFFRESADREAQMVSVERVAEYNSEERVPREAPLALEDDRNLPAGWPGQGQISVKNIEMSYREGLPRVLKGVSVEIRAGSRVGVVGRTGCGKSSFLITLLRICELNGGSITIDGQDVRNIGLHTLRGKAAIIPQDPAILAGSVKFNLDPMGLSSNEELELVLKKAQLWDRVLQGGGLDSPIEEGGGNYSIGELQLLCLARALLRRQETGGLLLLDEATSSLDAETDKIIQTVIREQFSCTTITIAHRIQTLMDYDMILVLDQGLVKEYASPAELMETPGSVFKSLANEAGAKLEEPSV